MNISAEYLESKSKINTGQVQPIQGQIIMGQPIVQQYTPLYVDASIHNNFLNYMQIAVQPQNQAVVATYPVNLIALKEYELRSQTRYFYGCSCCFGIVALIFMTIRCVLILVLGGGASIAAAVLYIFSDLIFMIGIIGGLCGVSKLVDKLLLFYQVNIGVAFLFEIIASIFSYITITQADDKQVHLPAETDEQGDVVEEAKDVSQNNMMQVSKLIDQHSLLFFLLCCSLPMDSQLQMLEEFDKRCQIFIRLGRIKQTNKQLIDFI